ncbi:Clp protease N-terminal domain-containing protein [Streptomyces peucetius]|uniref:Peptidase n=1 Tax=Streptomyces peucetius TaxID=1950 RepID=A0ABY6I4P8_STRPE|nr:Clp protease N-terminal domain-containing protein [Streptomyces peucetius]UYQ60979.1 peptidase [Streptomyces peucetius]
MHSPAFRLPLQQPTPVPADVEAALTVELAAVVTGARRRVLRDGDRQIDTAHLLHSLMELDPEVRAAFGGPSQVARVLGYLVQRSIGYGLAWQGFVEDSGALSVLRGSGGPGRPPGAAVRGVPGWSPSAVAAVAGALERARLRGRSTAEGIDVLACLAADPDCRAAEVLRRARVDPALLGARIPELSRHVSSG